MFDLRLVVLLALLGSVDAKNSSKSAVNVNPFGTLSNFLNVAKGMQKIDVFQTLKNTAVNLVAKYLLPSTNVNNTQCLEDLKWAIRLVASSKQSLVDIWPVNVLDSMGKPPTGILRGNLYWLGNFEQCIAIDVDTQLSTTEKHKTKFTGEYCLIEIKPKLQIKYETPIPISFKVGVCFPSTCSYQDISDILNAGAFRSIRPFATISLKDKSCQTKNSRTMDTVATVILVSMAMWVMVIVVATIVDYRVSEKLKLKEGFFKIKVIITKMFTSLSVIKSWNGIFYTQAHDDELSAIHGIRVVSILWVITGHTIMVTTLDYPWQNQRDVVSVFDYIWLQPFGFSATMSVQTFFVVSGLLVSYNFMKHKISNGWLNLCGYFAFRYLRLTPPYFVVIMFLAGPYYLLNTGPVWPVVDNIRDVCREVWWRNMLYIQTFWHDKTCMAPSWYLDVDTQLYCLAPIFLFTVYRKPRLGYTLLSIAFVSSVVYSFTMIWMNGYETFITPFSNMTKFQEFTDHLFFKATYNAPAYIVGLTIGYVLHLIKKSKFNLKPARKNQFIFGVSIWIVVLTMMVIIVFGTFSYNKGMNNFNNVVYGSLARPVWAICVAWILLACSLDWGGPINTILSSKIFVPFSRVTYSAYLVHYPVVYHYFAGQKDSIYFSIHNMLVHVIYCAVVSYGAAILLAIFIESPIVELVHVVWNLRPAMWSTTDQHEQEKNLIKTRSISDQPETSLTMNLDTESD